MKAAASFLHFFTEDAPVWPPHFAGPVWPPPWPAASRSRSRRFRRTRFSGSTQPKPSWRHSDSQQHRELLLPVTARVHAACTTQPDQHASYVIAFYMNKLHGLFSPLATPCIPKRTNQQICPAALFTFQRVYRLCRLPRAVPALLFMCRPPFVATSRCLPPRPMPLPCNRTNHPGSTTCVHPSLVLCHKMWTLE